MSKIIKSGQCVEAHPRQLQPVDVDSFFIPIEEADQEELITETSLEDGEGEVQDGASADQPVTETNLESTEAEVSEEPGEQPNDSEETFGDETAVVINPADRMRLASNLLDFEDHKPKPKFNSRQENPSDDSMEARQETAANSEPETVNLDHIANVAANIESLFSGAKQQAGSITESSQYQTEMIESASKRAEEALEQAKKQADEIAFGAEHKAGSIVSQASHQAETMINLANDQSKLIIEGARLQAEKSVEKAKHQAEVILENAKKEAAGIVEDAQKQIAVMLEETNQQSITIKEQAHQDGLLAGRQDAVNVVRKELSDNLTQALLLINEIESERMQRLASSEPELLKLAVTIAEKIIGDEIKLDAIRQLQIVREALSRVTTANTVTIRIHSDDLPGVNENLALLQSSFSEPKPINVVEDCSIIKGSCFIETDHGNLDARIKSQLDRIMTELLKVGKIE